MTESRCLLDVQVIQSPHGPYLATLPIHRPHCAHGAAFADALQAFADGPAEVWMEGRWWADIDGGVLEIGSRAEETGRIEVPLGIHRARNAALNVAWRSRHHFYSVLGLDWSTVSGTRHPVYGDSVLVHRFGAAPALHPIPVEYAEFIEAVDA